MDEEKMEKTGERAGKKRKGDSPQGSDPNLEVRPLIMFLTDAKIQVSKILTDFFLEPKTGQKSIFLGKKAQTLRFSKRGVGWLVGWA